MDTKQNELETERTENASTEEIRSEIRGTRRNMDETLDELGERLHPRHLLDDVVEIFRGTPEGNASRDQLTRTTKRVGRSIASELKEHPLPALLVGAGLIWWIVDATSDDEDGDQGQRGRRRSERMRTGPGAVGYGRPYSRPGDYAGYGGGTQSYAGGTAGGTMGESSGGTGESMKDKAGEMASAAGDKISGAASAVSEKMSDLGSSALEYSERGTEAVSRQAGVLQDRFREASDEYPLAVGGAFLAAGLLAGLLLPRTDREDEWMGEASDELKDETREKAQELAERGKEAAVKTAGAALDEAEARGITPENVAEKASRVVSEAVNAGKETARQEGIGGSDIKEGAKAVGHAAAETGAREGQETARQVRE